MEEQTFCPKCGKEKYFRSKRCRSCYIKELHIRWSQQGCSHHNWKGGTHITKAGYLRYNPGKQKYAGQFVHRVVLEQKLGRPLAKNEYSHHINGDKLDNRPDNLEIISQPEHLHIHQPWLACARHPKWGHYMKRDANPDDYKKPMQKIDPITGRFIKT